MKLQRFQRRGFQFSLTFANGDHIVLDLAPLVGKQVSESHLNTARIDAEWGCLEFCEGAIDIEPLTLYRYALKHGVFKRQGKISEMPPNSSQTNFPLAQK
jgi:hypothetical protein